MFIVSHTKYEPISVRTYIIVAVRVRVLSEQRIKTKAKKEYQRIAADASMFFGGNGTRSMISSR